MKTPKSITLFFIAASAVAALLVGCYTPSGGFNPGTGRGFVYISTPTRPVTVTLVDTRNQEAFFRLDIPAGEQLTFKFVEGSGTGSRIEPTKMLWAVWEAKTEFGSLNNQLICPPASCRRIDVTYRPAPEDPPADPTLIIPPDSAIPTTGPDSPAGGPQPPNRPKD
ncbi:MAG: hypothetical protein EXS17_01630 [Phycisphaerales bacterium]|nr:hypothetical protein [Phycisphaerales bacterium]